MINVFNRKEVCITYDINEQARIRDILKNNHIDYEVATKNLSSPSPLGGSRDSTFGVDLSRCIEYKIYVKKTDYDLAMHLIQK